MHDQGFGEPADQIYLSDVSPKDKSWDIHRSQSDLVRDLYNLAKYKSLSERISKCSQLLGFAWVSDSKTGQIKPKLQSAFFCRCRHCPICQWRRKLMWTARLFEALPGIVSDYPTARYVFLTLTVKNCELEKLRSTLTWMNQSWQRLTQRKQWPALGFARSTEVTRSQDGTVHPHFHCLLMVRAGYFNDRSYINQAEWTELWQSCLDVAYTPIVHVRAVKPKKGGEDVVAGLQAAILETFKYQVKPDDSIGRAQAGDAEWLAELTRQLQKTRAIALGGVLKKCLSEDEPEDLIGHDDEPLEGEKQVLFGWREQKKRYVKTQSKPEQIK
jgi:plasmid rolling circle replication initiator protein Rep